MPKPKHILLIIIPILLLVYYFLIPSPLFKSSYSTILLNSDNEVIGASIATDGQWRFPAITKVPDKFTKALICFEDEYFYKHPGVNPVAFGRAFIQNIKAKRTQSGGSTISMQVIRMSRNVKNRNIFSKLFETIAATRLECSYSKQEILEIYATHAPYGGNVVGLEAASWRYFARSPNKLSWAESALLAVLPNAPSLIFPGKNNAKLLAKRNRLLKKMHLKGILDKETYQLAQLEPLPQKPFPLPNQAPHLLARLKKDGHEGKRVVSSLNSQLQEQVKSIIHRYNRMLADNGVHNACAMITDIETGKVLAYIGNIEGLAKQHSPDVDIITAKRSYGSLLKPVLYALSVDEGLCTPYSLLQDFPINIDGYCPRNFTETYHGAIFADKALAQSVNIPFVKLLKQYSTAKFLYKLRKLGLHSLNKSADYYGLSLILGGGESTMWELNGMYASMARQLNHQFDYAGNYNSSDIHSLTYLNAFKPLKNTLVKENLVSNQSLYFTFNALLDANRPGSENNWQEYYDAQKIAWKTGTSFGFRDAWCIGLNKKYVVSVWLGNADGEGKAGLTGIGTAAPLMFEIFSHLPQSEWFKKPLSLDSVSVCKTSGYKANLYCNDVEIKELPSSQIKSKACPYHKLIALDSDKKLQVNSSCISASEIKMTPWFVLPSVMEYYYRQNNPSYQILPPYQENCASNYSIKNIDFVNPPNGAKLILPTQNDGSSGQLVVEIAYRNPKNSLFWQVDGEFYGTTKIYHKKMLSLKAGKHQIVVTDNSGEQASLKFEIVESH